MNDSNESLILKLKNLRAHLYGLDSGSGEADLLHEAITALQDKQRAVSLTVCPHVSTSKDGTSYCRLTVSGKRSGENMPKHIYFQTVGGHLYESYGGEPRSLVACLTEKDAKNEFGKSYIKLEITWLPIEH